jgi:hypothetical protein
MNIAIINNGYKKFNNPIIGKTNIIKSSEGQIPNNFDFEHQQKNFDKINNILLEFNIYPTELYYVKWNIKDSNNRVSFIVKYSNPAIIWQKYESDSIGSGHNHIYIKKTKVYTTVFKKEYLYLLKD